MIGHVTNSALRVRNIYSYKRQKVDTDHVMRGLC